MKRERIPSDIMPLVTRRYEIGDAVNMDARCDVHRESLHMPDISLDGHDMDHAISGKDPL